MQVELVQACVEEDAWLRLGSVDQEGCSSPVRAMLAFPTSW